MIGGVITCAVVGVICIVIGLVVGVLSIVCGGKLLKIRITCYSNGFE